MRQNINLYQSVLIDKPVPLRARQAGLLLLGLLVLVAAMGCFEYWRLLAGQKALARLRTEERQRQELVARLETEYPQREKNPSLETEIRQVEQMLIGQKQILQAFGSRGGKGNAGMVATLEGLARHTRPGVWLRRIELTAGADQVTLAGSARQPEQVPAYLQHLGEKGVFSGQIFARLKLVRLKEQPGQIDFTLESEPDRQP